MPPDNAAASSHPENRLIQEAIDVCRGAMGDGGAQSRPETGQSAQRSREIAALPDWATERQLWVPSIVPFELENSKTREHHVFRVPSDPSRMFKFTKGPGWGIFPALLADSRHKPVRYWFEDRPATPQEYFERLLISNTHLMHDLDREEYPELNRLEGFVRSHGQFQAVTS